MKVKTEKTLRMSFDPKTIEHLGIKMYSQLPNAMAELIANAYDACSTRVEIFLNDTDVNNMEIIVKDNGFGMTYDDINDKFLRIGRNRREAGDTKLPCERLPPDSSLCQTSQVSFSPPPVLATIY